MQLWSEAFPNPSAYNQPSFVLEAKLAVDDLIFVALQDDQLMGACIAGYDGHRGWLYSVAVAHHARRKGVGSQLVQHTVQQLAGMGCFKVNLQVVQDNAEVVAFYESLGFSCEARISMGLVTEATPPSVKSPHE